MSKLLFAEHMFDIETMSLSRRMSLSGVEFLVALVASCVQFNSNLFKADALSDRIIWTP
jgi:hypothetical protein